MFFRHTSKVGKSRYNSFPEEMELEIKAVKIINLWNLVDILGVFLNLVRRLLEANPVSKQLIGWLLIYVSHLVK